MADSDQSSLSCATCRRSRQTNYIDQSRTNSATTTLKPPFKSPWWQRILLLPLHALILIADSALTLAISVLHQPYPLDTNLSPAHVARMAEPRNQNLRSKACHCRFGMSLQIQAINIPPNHVWAVQFLWPWSMIALPSNLQWSGHLYINHQWRTKTMCSIYVLSRYVLISSLKRLIRMQVMSFQSSAKTRDIASCIATMLDFVHVGVLGPSLWDDVSQDLRPGNDIFLISPLFALPEN